MPKLTYNRIDPSILHLPLPEVPCLDDGCYRKGANLFQTLSEDHGPALYRCALKQCHNQADAWDLVQTAFERALRKRPPVRNQTELRSWLTVVVRNLFLDRCRSCDRRLTSIDLDELPALEDDEHVEPAWRRFSLDMVVALLPRLSPTLRGVFALHIAGSAVPVIAKRLGISVVRVSAHLFRARRRLRSLLLEGEPWTTGPRPAALGPRAAGGGPRTLDLGPQTSDVGALREVPSACRALITRLETAPWHPGGPKPEGPRPEARRPRPDPGRPTPEALGP